MCFETKLIVEIDGGQHADRAADEQRTAWLQSEGFRVVRFWNNEVSANTTGVLQAISVALDDPPPHPAPTRGEEV